MDSTTDNDYFELEPYDQYKPQEAKFQASLKWLFNKAYKNSMPKYLNEPFFEENELGKSLRNDLVKELISGRVYCAACKNIFNNSALSKSHQKFSYFSTITDIFEYLSSNLIAVVDDETEDPVSAQIISQDSPFYVSAHLALIDSLMKAYAVRAIRIETTVNAVKKYTSFDPSTEMPTDLETTCILWLNKVTQTVLSCISIECELYAKQSSVFCQPHLNLPEIQEDLSGNLVNGTILAILIVFYTCDKDIDLSDISCQDVGFEESVENLNLVKEFCEKHFPSHPFCFNFEDFLYSPSSMKINKLAFLAELFFLFEVQPMSNLIQSNHFELFKDYIKKYTKKQYHATTPFLSARISDVTRNSFIKGSHIPSPSSSQDINKKQFPTKNDIDCDRGKKQIFAINLEDSSRNKSPGASVIKANASFNHQIRDSIPTNCFKKMSTTTNGSFNSLLDNVNLDQSQDVSSSTVIKSSNDSGDLQINQTKERGQVVDTDDFEYHPMFSSRTYVKAAPPISRPSLKQATSNDSIIKSVESTPSPRQKSTTPEKINLNLQNSNSTNIISETQSSIDIGMKTIRVNSNDNYIKPVITSSASESSNLKQKSTTQSSINSSADIKSTNEVVRAAEAATGLVRRPSVSARPGDIFYKVKDVTETETTDTLDQDTANQQEQNTESEEKEIIIKSVNKSYTISTKNPENRIDPVERIAEKSPEEHTSATTTTTTLESFSRKTTTWNKRHQTSALGVTVPQIDVIKVPVKDDIEETVLANNVEPGSEVFNKELLSIRMQLKEKKSSMERDKRKLESELERQRLTIGKQAFLQVVGKKSEAVSPEMRQKISAMTIPKFQAPEAVAKPPKIDLTAQPEAPKATSTDSTPSRPFESSSPRLSDVPRRQWDKSNKGFIDLENEPHTRQKTVHESAKPLDTSISKTNYSRDEMMKKIEVLKSTTIALASKAATTANRSTDSDTACKDIDTELSKANNKLFELQNEIARLNLLQQQQVHQTGQSFTVNKVDEDLNFAVQDEQQASISSNAVIEEPTEAENDTEKDGAFFISFGNGSAKREKPPALTPKKNLFVKTSPQEAEPSIISVSSNSLLMTAISDGKKTITKSHNVPEQVEIDDGDDDDSSDGDMKQRRKEMILQKQLERRQQQEVIRQQREEERVRKAEEIRMREEEAAFKKNLERTRKETIFQAYIDKKKQLQDESQTGYHFGGSKIAQSNLANAKKYHSTYRLKQAPMQHQQMNNSNFNNGEFNDQASMISDRSSSNVRYSGQGQASSSGGQQQTMLKTYSTNNLYQGNYNNNNLNATKKTAQNESNNGPAKRQSRVSRPPSCARPTISSLRKMNRTFSLNNVSDIGLSANQKTLLNALEEQQLAPKVVPLTQASLAAAEHQQHIQQQSHFQHSARYNPESESITRMSILNNANKFSNKYASSTFLSDYSTLQHPQKTRTAPRRRTPRNAEEFLTAAGIPDPDAYLTKGYYVGSMLNLNELVKSSPNDEQPHMEAQFMSQQFPQAAGPVSSSSSSSAGGFNTNKSHLNSLHHRQISENQNIQRRNSIHEATSISMANLDFLNSNFTSTSKRNKQQHARSATTAITGETADLHESASTPVTTTTGSSAPSSDSSSSPNPLHQRSQQAKHAGLGPLMSAVTKLETDVRLSSPRTNGSGNGGALNGFIEQRFFNSTQEPEDDDDFDEYEYLERNLGAEPAFNSNALYDQRRTLETNGNNTNTNVTDYGTDESNSCNNDTENNYAQFNSSKTLCNAEEMDVVMTSSNSHNHGGVGSYLNVNYSNSSFSVGGITPNSQTNNNNNNDYFNSNNHNNISHQQHQKKMGSHLNISNVTKASPRQQHGAGNGWDQASVVSNNSLFSGVDSENSSEPTITLPPIPTRPSDTKTSETDILRLMNNDHFKYTETCESTESKLDHLLRTNAALSLMSKIHLISNLNNRHSMTSTPTVSIRQRSYNGPETNTSRYRMSSRPTSFVLSESISEAIDLESSANINNKFKRSFAPPPNALQSLLNSDSFTAFDLHNLSSSSSESGSSPQNFYGIKKFSAETDRLQRPDKINLDLPNSYSMHSIKSKTYKKQEEKKLKSPMAPEVPEYSGPKLFKRLTGKSNKLAIVNSLNHRVLAGVVNAAVRKQVIDEIEASDERHFIILFRDYHLQYRAIYSYTTETDYIEKVVGVGPQKISEDMIETYFKYNSGARQFTAVPTKHFSVQCDGVSIHSIYWQSRKASNPLTNVATLGGSQSAIANNYGTVRR